MTGLYLQISRPHRGALRGQDDPNSKHCSKLSPSCPWAGLCRRLHARLHSPAAQPRASLCWPSQRTNLIARRSNRHSLEDWLGYVRLSDNQTSNPPHKPRSRQLHHSQARDSRALAREATANPPTRHFHVPRIQPGCNQAIDIPQRDESRVLYHGFHRAAKQISGSLPFAGHDRLDIHETQIALDISC